MFDITTSIEIDAPAERVWGVMTAFAEYDEWNPMITRMRASLAPSSKVSFVINLSGKEVPIRATMVAVEPGREIRWKGPRSLALGVLFSGEHYLRVEPAAEGRSVFHHGEHFSGVTVPVLWSRLRPELEKAYSAMNRAVRARAEAAGPRASRQG